MGNVNVANIPTVTLSSNAFTVSNNVTVNTSYCVNITFVLTNNGVTKKYVTNKSLFSKTNQYILDNNMNLTSKYLFNI